ncbi:MAG: hypothetical protein GXN99_00945, partial [Candidatus Nanohaloarchaeota archaeon]|nr:hypothetical protein [Candidatus Nanohaloarchaeota archaeon]
MKSYTHVLVVLAGIIVITSSILVYNAFATIDFSKPWHTLQQISISPSSDISIDENNNGRIDIGRTEETLQSITNNGAETTHALTLGGLTVTGTSTFTGSATFN